MTADRLRQAAEVLRDRAEAAQRGPWSKRHYGSGFALDNAGATFAHVYATDATASFIATMSPDVALAVAEMLDDAAGGWDFHVEQSDSAHGADHYYQPALALANAILGAPQ